MMRPERGQFGLRSAARTASLALFFFATAGMLIWGKLRLVGEVPRSAWAVPEPAVEGAGERPIEPEPMEPEPMEPGSIEPDSVEVDSVEVERPVGDDKS